MKKFDTENTSKNKRRLHNDKIQRKKSKLEVKQKKNLNTRETLEIKRSLEEKSQLK